MNCGYGYCGSSRGFLTRNEKLQMLQEYKEDLDNEAKGVAERIAELKLEK